MISLFNLIRYKNLLMVLLTMVLTKYALVECFLIDTNFSDTNFVVLTLAVLLITSGGYIINDLYDIQSDRINKPSKMYIPYSISKKSAWTLYILMTTSGLLLGMGVSYYKEINYVSIFFVVPALLLFIYSASFKKLPLIGNLLIAFLVALPIFLVFKFEEVSIVTKDSHRNSSLSKIVILYMLFAFLTTFIREIVKDLQDFKGDFAAKLKTMPILLGVKMSKNIVLFLAFLLIFSFVLLFVQFLNSQAYYLLFSLVIVSSLSIYFVYKIHDATTNKEFHYLSSLMKVVMLTGILSMSLFKFT